MLGVEGHNTLAGGTGGGVNTDALRKGHTQKAVGISLPQVVLAEERQLVQIGNALNVCGGQALFFHFFAVVGHIVPHMLHLLDKTLVLPLLNLFTGSGFNFRLIILRNILLYGGIFPVYSCHAVSGDAARKGTGEKTTDCGGKKCA